MISFSLFRWQWECQFEIANFRDANRFRNSTGSLVPVNRFLAVPGRVQRDKCSIQILANAGVLVCLLVQVASSLTSICVNVDASKSRDVQEIKNSIKIHADVNVETTPMESALINFSSIQLNVDAFLPSNLLFLLTLDHLLSAHEH